MTDQGRARRISKTLSYWLRHDPAAGGLSLDSAGWAPVRAVLDALKRSIGSTALADLEAVVRESDKQRFSIVDGRIRANQGHSIPLDIVFRPIDPPALLFHGTTWPRWRLIQESGGLQKMQRHHVHLSPDVETARRVAGRHRGERPVILRIDALTMTQAGHAFWISDNGVYLAEAVPVANLSVASNNWTDAR